MVSGKAIVFEIFFSDGPHTTSRAIFPERALKFAEVLKIAGRIFPSTAANVSLEAVLDDGKVLRGESRISRSPRRIHRIRLQPNRVRPLKETLEAIARADLITLGPGSLFTSVIPNLLVSGIPKAIRQARARKAYFMNLMTQPGETTHFSASDHVLVRSDGHARQGQKLLDHRGGEHLPDIAGVACASIWNRTPHPSKTT